MKLPEFKLERLFAQYEFTAKHLLCASDCESLAIEELLAFEPEARERLLTQRLGYTEATGSAGLRSEISNLYDSILPSHILTFAGAQEAIFLFMQAMLEAGDHAIVHWPCYQSLFEVAHGMGVSVDRWQADAARDWRLDLDRLQSLIRPHTKVIIINVPHNPTGYLMRHDDYAALHAIAAERGVLVLCDEVYRESEYDESDRLTAGCDMGEHAVSLGVMSKTYGLAGLRIGWITTRNQNVFERIQILKDYTSMCNSAPSELLAEVALRHRQKVTARNLRIINRNIDLLDEFFAARPDEFVWARPKAGCLAFPKYLGGDIDEFCARLIKETGVLLAPGSIFQDAENHFRIGFGHDDFPEGLAVMNAFMSQVL